MPAATPDDVAVPLLRPLSDAEVAYAAKLLVWAEAIIRKRYPDLSALDQDALVLVESQAVARVLRNPDGRYTENLSGEYSYSRDKILADGLLRISDEEWELLDPSTEGSGGAFSVDTAPKPISVHADVCSLVFGATYCSCGADIAGYPIYGGTI